VTRVYTIAPPCPIWSLAAEQELASAAPLFPELEAAIGEQERYCQALEPNAKGKGICVGWACWWMAFGVGALATAPLAYFAGLGLGASGAVGCGIGTLALVVREAIQWATSGSPHLVDRALDIAPGPLAGWLGGIGCWLLVSRFLL
jgi:hypothetical protein